MVSTGHLSDGIGEDTPIWRYMSYSSFMWTIQKGFLNFRRADCFDDPYEGTFPKAVIQQMSRELNEDFGDDADGIMENWIRTTNMQRKITFLNCWHINPGQSAAMWEQYSLADKGIAIRSTIGGLIDAISQFSPLSGDGIGVADVGYVDFESELDEIDLESRKLINNIVGMEGGGINGMDLFRLKRREFQHESELRAYIQFHSLVGFDDKIEVNDYPFGIKEPKTELNWDAIPEASNVHVEIDLDTLVDEIVLYPNTSDWVTDSIKASLDNLDALDLTGDDVSISELYSRPDVHEL